MMFYPLRFESVFREYIWGGRRLGDVLCKPIGDGPRYAESWEIVDHGEDQSVVANGPLQGQTLGHLIQDHREEMLGVGPVPDRFPLLLKYLDCNRDLSVQVHPDDEYGQQMSPPDYGKTEAWYIVSAEPGSLIYAGLKEGVGPDDMREACARQKTEDVLHTLSPSAGDCVFIPAGTVHALGAGLLVAEIQQSSDTTFRLYDWNRVDDAGNARPLHIEQAIEVTDYHRGPVSFQVPQPLDEPSTQRLVACDKFVLDRLSGEFSISIGEDDKFYILTVVAGAARLKSSREDMPLSLGQSVLVPACVRQSVLISDDPETVALRMSLP